MLNKGAKGRLAEGTETEAEIYRSITAAGNDGHITQVLYGGCPPLVNSAGVSWTAACIDTTGEPTADLRSNIAAEARAKIVYGLGSVSLQLSQLQAAQKMAARGTSNPALDLRTGTELGMADILQLGDSMAEAQARKKKTAEKVKADSAEKSDLMRRWSNKACSGIWESRKNPASQAMRTWHL